MKACEIFHRNENHSFFLICLTGSFCVSFFFQSFHVFNCSILRLDRLIILQGAKLMKITVYAVLLLFATMRTQLEREFHFQDSKMGGICIVIVHMAV